MLMRSENTGLGLNNGDLDITISKATMQKRLAPGLGYFLAEGVYSIDSITPDYICMRAAVSEEALKSGSLDNMVVTQLGVLSETGNKTLGIGVNTLYPGGIAMSDLIFMQFPSKEKMLDTEKRYAEASDNFMRSIYEMIISGDSIQNLMLETARSVNAMPPAYTDEPENVEREIPEILKSSDFIKTPDIRDFFNIPSGSKGKAVSEAIAAIPFPMISYNLSPADMSLTASLEYSPLVSLETSAELKPYYRGSIRYLWDGKKYKKAQDKGK